MTVTFSISGLCSDRPPTDLALLIVDVEARFRIACGSTVILDEPHFPVAELAIALSRWASDDPDRGNFDFDSMSAEESGVVSLRQDESGCWIVGSIWQLSPCRASLSLPEVDELVARYVRAVREGLRAAWGNAAVDLLDSALNA